MPLARKPRISSKFLRASRNEPSRLVRVSLLIVLGSSGLLPGASAQEKPRRDVIEVPAIGEGLCVSQLFQTNMVLQRDQPIHVWGFGTPGEEVTVRFGESSSSTSAGEDRRWKVTLPAAPVQHSPRRMVIEGAEETLTLENILVGDVWVLGGQSNMEFELAKVENGALEIASANHPRIRILTVPYGEGPAPKPGFARLDEWSDWFGRHFRKGDWDVCRPEIARELSAIGYVFARRVHMASGVPIGVIDVSRGGTTVETWTPEPVLRAMEESPVVSKLADWDRRVAEWDPEEDLERRRRDHRRWVERMKEEGRSIPADRVEPTDLRPGPLADPNYPGSCYAGMLSPLEGLSIKGVIFHQGYNNAFDGMPGVELYRVVFPAMIRAWRQAFQNPDMPFGILSLCTDGEPQTRENYVEKMLDTGIDIRAVQYETFLRLLDGGDRHIGFASTYDLRRSWYHPQVKIPAGERIARWALSTQYGFGRELPWMPPRLLDMEAREDALVLKLDQDVDDPEGGTIEGFAIAGADRRFHPAKVVHAEIGKDDRGRPRLDRKQLVLTSPLVREPIHFRYAWGRHPLANLQVTGNKDLPFATQRSDDWHPGEVPRDVLGEEWKGSQLTRNQRSRILQELRREDLRRRVIEARLFLEEHAGEFDDEPRKRKD